MDETVLSWNFTNWVTVVLMAAVGFFALSVLAQALKTYQAKQAA